MFHSLSYALGFTARVELEPIYVAETHSMLASLIHMNEKPSRNSLFLDLSVALTRPSQLDIDYYKEISHPAHK